MLFRRKKSEPANVPADDPRKYYRVRRGESQRIHATLERAPAPSVLGECVDLSIGGAWVEFERNEDPGLAPEAICWLRIREDSLPETVVATCRVVVVQKLETGRIRVGFEFTNRIELYAQLDEHYAALFNRRRHVRASAEGEGPVQVRITWREGSLRAIANDISEGGLGIVLPLETARFLARDAKVELLVQLPEEREGIACRGTIRTCTDFAKSCLVGIEFAADSVEVHLPALRLCVAKRLAAFEARSARMKARRASRRAS
jgi:c-di-GMP-binding flagellar brake protein YcgR